MSFKEKFDKEGYLLVKDFLSEKEVVSIRKKADTFFNNDPTRRMMIASEVIKYFPEIEKIQTSPTISKILDELFEKDDWAYINDFQLQKNLVNIGHGGWHADCNSQYADKSTKNKLDRENYKFCKIGIYLQDGKCPYGGSIEILRSSHKLPKFLYSFFSFIFNNRILSIFTSDIFRKKIDKNLNAGDLIIFDCRLIHRSSKIKNLSNLNLDNYSQGVFKEVGDVSKYSLYFEVGDKRSNEIFLLNNFKRSYMEDDIFFSDYLRFSDEDFFINFSSEYRKSLKGKISYLKKNYRKFADESISSKIWKK